MTEWDPVKNPAICQSISQICGAPLIRVQGTYPLLYQELATHKLANPFTVIIALATYATENGTWEFIKERGGPNYYFRMYDIQGEHPERAKRLGNTEPGDGAKYCGRGPLQLTGKYNYAKYGKIIGQDLVTFPDKALEPRIAIQIFRAYFHDHGLDVWSQKWGNAKTAKDKETSLQKCRKLVNGGLNGYDRFKKVATALLALKALEV